MFPIGEHNFPMGIRGRWIDSQTFLFEYDTITNQDAYALELHFDVDTVTINTKEHTHQAVMTLVGKAQDQ